MKVHCRDRDNAPKEIEWKELTLIQFKVSQFLY